MKKQNKKKQPHKSKMITGYIIYASEIRKEVIKKYPEKDFGDISKLVGIEWKSLSQEAKVVYEKRAQEQNHISKMVASEAACALELNRLADAAAVRAADEQQQQQQQNSMASAFQQQQFQQQYQQHHLQQQQQQQQQQVHMAPQQQQPPLHHQQQVMITQNGLHNGAPLTANGHDAIVDNNNNTSVNGSATPIIQPFSSQQQVPQHIFPPHTPNHYQIPMVHSPNMIVTKTPMNFPQPQPSPNQHQPHQNQQQPPLQIIQQQQHPIATVIHCCNGNCTAPYVVNQNYIPYPQIPPQLPSIQQQQQQPAQQKSTLLQPPSPQFKRNNIVYRKPATVRLRPKDASTQTDQIKWIDKSFEQKKSLKFSQKFIDYLTVNGSDHC